MSDPRDYGSPEALTHATKLYLERKATAEEVAKALILYLDRLGRPFEDRELQELHDVIQRCLTIERHQNGWRDSSGTTWSAGDGGVVQMVRGIGAGIAAKLWDMGYRRAK